MKDIPVNNRYFSQLILLAYLCLSCPFVIHGMNQQRFHCQYNCGKKLLTKRRILLHEKGCAKNPNKVTFKCLSCPREFDTHSGLQSHKTRTHTKKQTSTANRKRQREKNDAPAPLVLQFQPNQANDFPTKRTMLEHEPLSPALLQQATDLSITSAPLFLMLISAPSAINSYNQPTSASPTTVSNTNNQQTQSPVENTLRGLTLSHALQRLPLKKRPLPTTQNKRP